MSCFHVLVELKPHEPATEGKPYRYRCTRCDKRLKNVSGRLVSRPEPQVKFKLTTSEVMALIGLLELRQRTPDEEHILQACYRSKIDAR